MADKRTLELLADLPEDWGYGQIVAPEGESVGLTPQHGYNYLMRKVNACARALNEIVKEMGQIVPADMVTANGGGQLILPGILGDGPYIIEFTAEEYTITLTVEPEGNGTVEGAGTYQAGDTVTIKAAAEDGYQFSGWKEDGVVVSESAEYTFVVDGNRTLTAEFTVATLEWALSTLPSSAHWHSVTYGNGKFVAVAEGNGSVAAYSKDGINWTAATLPSSAYWFSVTYGNGKFVAVAYNSNEAAYSTDGITWTAASLPSSVSWYSVTYGNGKFVAVAYNSNEAAYSTDGITWTAASLPSSAYWFSVTYGNGKFVAVTSGNKVAYSTDGITWIATILPSSSRWYSVTYGNGKFVAVAFDSNEAAYSTDGISWTAAALPSSTDWFSVTYGNGRFVAVANNSNEAAYTLA